MKKEKHFALESDLCAAFLKVLPKGWTAYPETAGWDILLSRDADGFQIGIQAKLKLNGNVLTQCLEGPWCERNGPDCRAVLVPYEEDAWQKVCDYIGISVIKVAMEKRWSGRHQDYAEEIVVRPKLPGDDTNSWNHNTEWHEWLPAQRHPLPEYVPDVTAGVPAPLQLTKWKIKAIKCCILLEKRGYLTRADFKHVGMDHRRWIAKDFGWLVIDPVAKVYRPGQQLPDLKRQHPTNWVQIEADAAK